MTTITEIAPDIFRISTYDSSIDLQFIQFLTMHGSTFVGDGAQAIRDLSIVMREELDPQMAAPVSHSKSH